MSEELTSLEEAYSVLDVKPGASLREVNQAYEDMLDLWRPDRLADNPRLRARAPSKNREIRAAYELLFNELSRARKPAGSATLPSQPTVNRAIKPTASIYEDAIAERGHQRSRAIPAWLVLTFVVAVTLAALYFLTLGEEVAPAREVTDSAIQPPEEAGQQPPAEEDSSKPNRPEEAAGLPASPPIEAQSRPDPANQRSLTPQSVESPTAGPASRARQQSPPSAPRRAGGPALIRDELFEEGSEEADRKLEQPSFEHLKLESAAVRELLSGVAGYDFIDWIV
ncbi:MAG: DnaJ domain-containing protein, partial [Acidobacteriota bacterium]